MKRRALIIALAAAAALTTATGLQVLPAAEAGEATMAKAVAAEQSVTFAIERMTCAACPITVRKAMEGVGGVKSVEVNLGAKTATVNFDPPMTTPAQIAAASSNAGYPATPAL